MKRFLLFVLLFCASFWLFNCSQSQIPARPTELPKLPSVTPIPSRGPPSPTPTQRPSPTPTRFFTPTISPPTSQPCTSETGSISSKQLTTSWLPDPLAYQVYTPPCYDHLSDQYFPVLFLIHGYGFNDDQWVRLKVDEIADRLITTGESSPFIIVMPHDSDHNNLPPENRFGEALVNDLIPVIDSSYRTVPLREFRAIGGLSRGGNWAIHLGLTYWPLFGAIGGHSSPIFVTDGPSKIEAWLVEIPYEQFPDIYLDIGTNDKWLDHTFRFEETLDRHNVPHELYLFPGGHNEDYWAAHTEQYIRWYTSNW